MYNDDISNTINIYYHPKRPRVGRAYLWAVVYDYSIVNIIISLIMYP